MIDGLSSVKGKDKIKKVRMYLGLVLREAWLQIGAWRKDKGC